MKYDRRGFVKTLALSGFSLEVARHLGPILLAQTASNSLLKLVLIRMSHGGIPHGQLEGENFLNLSQSQSISSSYQIRTDTLANRIASFGKISDILGPSFSPYAGQINVLTHLSAGYPFYGNHNFGGFLGCGLAGWPPDNTKPYFDPRPTLDQVVSDYRSAQGIEASYGKPLVIADQWNTSGIRGPSWRVNPAIEAQIEMVAPQDNFDSLWQILFSALGSNAQVISAKQNVLEKLAIEVESLKGKALLPQSYQNRLGLYKDLVLDIKDKVAAGSCGSYPADPNSDLLLSENYALLAQFLAAAITCNRVSTISYGATRPSGVLYGSGGDGSVDGLHAWVHNPNGEGNLTKITNAWLGFFNNLILPLVQSLQAVDELKNTLIVCVPENQMPHINAGFTAVTFGGQAHIATGRITSYANYLAGQDLAIWNNVNEIYQPYNRAGLHLNALFEKLLSAAGLPEASYSQWVAPGHAFGDYYKIDPPPQWVTNLPQKKALFDQIYSDANVFNRKSKIPLL